MTFDVFISYAHQRDNNSREAVVARVAQLHSELEADFLRRFNRALEIFFDKEDIEDFDHWQVRCHRALRDSRFFIACLSRTYLRSEACRWEWEEWCRHELEHGFVGQALRRCGSSNSKTWKLRKKPTFFVAGRETCSSDFTSGATSGVTTIRAPSSMRWRVPNCSNSPSTWPAII